MTAKFIQRVFVEAELPPTPAVPSPTASRVGRRNMVHGKRRAALHSGAIVLVRFRPKHTH